MTRARSTESLVGLVRELLKLPRETEWVELKHDNDKPEEIGEYISALANSAALEEKAFAYVLWGIDDATRAVIGTTFAPAEKRVGNEELESWLLRLLSPKIDFRFFDVDLPEGHAVVLEISRAFPHPASSKTRSTFASAPTRRSSRTTKRKSASSGAFSTRRRSRRASPWSG